MIIIIDNYDSFTYNVYQALAKITNEEIRVLRSRECTIADIEKLNPSRLIVSPGPGRPEDAGVSVEAIKHFAGKLPILGVCLGYVIHNLLSSFTIKSIGVHVVSSFL